MAMDLGKGGHGQTDTLIWYLPGWTKKNNEILQDTLLYTKNAQNKIPSLCTVIIFTILHTSG
jgi:hypothetical protein